MLTKSAEMARVLRAQRVFLVLVAAGGLVRLATPALSGAGATWAMIGSLWLLGAVLAGWARSEPDRGGDLMATVAVQNLAIQAFVALPGVVAGTWRLLRAAEEGPGGGYWANALVTVIAVPLLSAIVLSFLGLAVASAVRQLRPAA